MFRTEERFAEWTAAERAEYAALHAARPAQAADTPVPLILRETLLALGDESGDDGVRRELARYGGPGQEPVE